MRIERIPQSRLKGNVVFSSFASSNVLRLIQTRYGAHLSFTSSFLLPPGIHLNPGRTAQKLPHYLYSTFRVKKARSDSTLRISVRGNLLFPFWNLPQPLLNSAHSLSRQHAKVQYQNPPRDKGQTYIQRSLHLKELQMRPGFLYPASDPLRPARPIWLDLSISHILDQKTFECDRRTGKDFHCLVGCPATLERSLLT